MIDERKLIFVSISMGFVYTMLGIWGIINLKIFLSCILINFFVWEINKIILYLKKGK